MWKLNFPVDKSETSKLDLENSSDVESLSLPLKILPYYKKRFKKPKKYKFVAKPHVTFQRIKTNE